LSVEYMVFIKKIAYKLVEWHRVKSCFHMPGIRPVENLPTLGVWMNSIFMNCENVEFWNREVAAILGHSDSSSRSEQSTPEVVWWEFWDGAPAIFILRLIWSHE
jgi:hypothetical protein